MRTAGSPLNYSNLTIQPPADYILGPNDILEITIPGLFEKAEATPIRVQVMASNEVQLPLVGPVVVGGKNLKGAQEAITHAFSDGYLVEPRVNVTLAEKSSTSILVLGKVQQPGVHVLPKFENDVGHALAAAGGLLEESADVIEIHRRIPTLAKKRPHLVSDERPAAYPVQLARFQEVTPGLSRWVHDDHAPAEHSVLRLGSPSEDLPVAQPPITVEQETDWSNPQYSEPWLAQDSRPTQPADLPQVADDTFVAWQPAPPHKSEVPAQIAGRPQIFGSQEFLPAPHHQLPISQEHRVIDGDKMILRIPLRQTGPTQLSKADISLQPGDVVVVPGRRHEVFYVVGRLNTTNNVRFTIGDRERELGVGFVLPREREIDVVTAVVMAGYIDPIDSPTTVTVHRVGPDGNPFLIHVDLIKARYDARETVLVQAGDIIYLNPDSCWWLRRTFDRIVPDLIIEPFKRGIGVNRN